MNIDIGRINIQSQCRPTSARLLCNEHGWQGLDIGLLVHAYNVLNMTGMG